MCPLADSERKMDMNSVEYVRSQFASMRRLSDAVLRDTTDEQLNWTPPGEANPIRAALVHVMVAEDRYIQGIVQGRPMIWQAGGWAERVGLPVPPGYGKGWDEVKATTLALSPLLEYGSAVRTATEEYLTALTPEDLDRTVAFIGGERPVADVLAQLVVHTSGHVGEIAALKGLQGVKGLPM